MQFTRYFVAGSLLFGSIAHASDQRGYHPPMPFTLDASAFAEDSLIVKFVDDLPIRLEAGKLRLGQVSFASSAIDLAPYQQLLNGSTVERVFSREPADLEAERTRLLENLQPGQVPPADLNNYYRVITSGAAKTEELVNALYGMDLVENCYAECKNMIQFGGDIAPTTPDMDSEQDYLNAAPTGHGYNSVRNIVGAQGQDLTVCHQEGSWYFGHEDSCNMVLGAIVGDTPSSDWNGWQDHGTACVGILNADRNSFGVRGMASEAGLVLSSLENGGADAISLATAALSAGDVMESSWGWGLSNGAGSPLDFFSAEWDAVNIATLSGIHYLYSAGNTDLSLDDTNLFGNVYTPGAPDNGGTIVGASNSGNLDKIWFSNYGTRVDCSAWGEDITTLGYGDRFFSGDVQSYTSGFGGTSGAAPICAGVAAALSGALQIQDGVLLSPFDLRQAMRTIGTPQGAGGNIGPRADLAALLANYGLPDGLELQGDGAINASFTLEVSGQPNSPFVMFLSADRGNAPTSINRKWLIDLSSFFLVTGLSTNGAGEASLSAIFPNDPGFIDSSLFFQVLNADANGDLHLTNSVELWIRE